MSSSDGASKKNDIPEVIVTGQKFEPGGPGTRTGLPIPLEFRVPARETDIPDKSLNKGGANNLGDIVDAKNQIVVFWFVGIHKFSGDELHLALKYCGQGVEGLQFESFRPPSSFDQESVDGELRNTLKRQTNGQKNGEPIRYIN